MRLTALALALVSVPASPSLERAPREDSIYEISGSPEQLVAFDLLVQGWEGGEFVGRSEDGTTYKYWAYSERSARQARQFLVPAVGSGLNFKVVKYDQLKSFPEIRAIGDRLALLCGAKKDPFFVTPHGRLAIADLPENVPDLIDCLRSQSQSLHSGMPPKPKQ